MATTSPTTTSSSLTSSSLITALGGGSGVDMAALASNLAAAQFQVRTGALSSKSDTLTTKISTASNIKSMLLSLNTSLGTLVRSGELARTPSVANTAVAAATLSGTAQPSGSYSLEVTKLATGQHIAMNAYASSADLIGSGTLTIRFGTVAGDSFNQGSQPSVQINIDGDDTLADAAKAINASEAGLTAYVANTADGAQLVVKGADGSSNGFIIEASEDLANPGLSNLAWSPGGSGGTLLSAAQNASLSIDGLPYTSASNTIADAIPGVKLQLTGTNSGSPTVVSFSDPADDITSSMQDFVDALNELMGTLDTATAVGGDLANDAGARSLKRSLGAMGSSTVMPSATGVARTLADLGLSTQSDGTFRLDTNRLESTLEADPQGVVAMFTNGLYGVYSTFDKIYRAATSSTDSNSLGSSINRYNKQLTQVADDMTTVAEQQEALRGRLASQFTVSETRISVLKSTQAMLENQIAAWNKSDD